MSVPALDTTHLVRWRDRAWLASPALGLAAVAAVLLLGLALRLFGLDAKSLWYDEAASLYFARQPLPDLIYLTMTRDTPPPLYYLALHGWLRVFGDSVAALRGLSALASVLCLPLLYALARALTDRATALAATALLAVSPFQVWYAQETRMYALLALAGLASTLALVRLIQAPGRGRWLVYVVATAAMLWTHYLALFTLAGQALVVLVIGLRWQPAPAVRRWTWSAVLAGGATLLPWLPAFLVQSRTYSRFWIPLATPEQLERALWEYSALYAPYWRLPLDRPLPIVAGFLALAAVGAVALRRQRVAWLLPVALAVLPVALAYAAGSVRPLFLSRTLILITPLYYLLLAAGLVWLARWRWPVAVLAVAWVVAWNGLGLQHLYRNAPKEPWDEAVRYVVERSQPGDPVLFHSAPGQWPFEYYLRQYATPLALHGLPADIDRSTGALEQAVTPADLPRLEALLAAGRPVWLVLSHTEYVDPDRLVAAYLDDRWAVTDQQEFYRIEVRRYAP
jgi:4-amino-4-deoxy-L-arabinose transferase-like glycosyltransferase